MEPESFSNEEKEKSPSQENTAHFQAMKRDTESLEDFEEITKDEPSFKDITAQFLEFETNGNSHKFLQGELNFQRDQSDLETEDKDGSGVNYSQEGMARMPEKLYDSQIIFLNGANQTANSGVGYKSSSNDSISLEDPYSQAQPENLLIFEPSTEKPIINNDEISTASDHLLFSPEKEDSSPVSYSDFEKILPNKPLAEHRPNELTDSSFTTQPFSKFTSEPGLTRELEIVGRQGDGLHVKDNFEPDASDNDDVAPEPIPKDYPEIGVIEGKHFLAALGIDTWFHTGLLHPKVESLIYWRDPKKSGIVFGSVLAILLSLTTFSLISVIAHTSLLVLVAALAFRIYKSVLQAVQKTSDGHPFKAYLDAVVNHPIITTVFFTIEEYLDIDLTLNPEKAREVSDVVISHVNKILTKCRSLFLVEDVIDSVKFAILLWCLTYVGAWFNGLSLLIIAFVGLFTLPKVYENNKTQIDANIDIVKNKINDVSEKIRAVIPLGKKADEVKDKGE